MPDDNTLLFLRFDGNFDDSSRYKRQYQSSTGVAIDEKENIKSLKCSYNGGLLFPTDNAFNFGSSDFTIEGWIKTEPTSGYQGIAGKRLNQATAGAWCFGISGSSKLNLSLSSNGSSFAYDLNGGFIDTGWTHVVMERLGNRLLGFVAGKIVINQSITAITLNSNIYPVTIGNYYHTFNGEGFRGLIKGLKISNIARYTANFDTPINELVGRKLVDRNTLLLLRFEGNLKDSSVYSKLITGSVQAYEDGKLGLCARLTSAISYSLLIGSGDFTIECFLKINTTRTYASIAGNGTDQDAGMCRFDLSSGGVIPRFYIAGGTKIMSSNTTLSTGVWYHLAVAREGGTTRIFVNGEQKNQMEMAYDISRTRFVTGDGATFSVDELRISDIARYTGSFNPPTQAF